MTTLIDTEKYDIVLRDIRALEQQVLVAAGDLVANMECAEGVVEVRYSHENERREMVTVPCGSESCDYCRLALALANLNRKVDDRMAFLTRTA